MSWSIECPPPTTAPASATFSAPPRRISSSISARQHRQRERRERQRQDRAAAHRVDVGERVGRGDLAEDERVVHDRREEIHREDERLSAADPIHRRVVGRVVADQQVGILRDGELREKRGEIELPILQAQPALDANVESAGGRAVARVTRGL